MSVSSPLRIIHAHTHGHTHAHTHIHTHPSPSPPDQSLTAQVGLFLLEQIYVWNVPWSGSSKLEGKTVLKSHRSEC